MVPNSQCSVTTKIQHVIVRGAGTFPVFWKARHRDLLEAVRSNCFLSQTPGALLSSGLWQHNC